MSRMAGILPTRPELLSQRLTSAAFVRQAARDGKIPVPRDSKKYPPFFLMVRTTPPSRPGKRRPAAAASDGGKGVAYADAFILMILLWADSICLEGDFQICAHHPVGFIFLPHPKIGIVKFPAFASEDSLKRCMGQPVGLSPH